jgi:hypothetical protein
MSIASFESLLRWLDWFWDNLVDDVGEIIVVKKM